MRQICSIAICLAILFITPYAYPGDKKTTGTGYWSGNTFHYEETTKDDSLGQMPAIHDPSWDYLNRQRDKSDAIQKSTFANIMARKRTQAQNNAQIKQTIIQGIIEGKITEEDGKRLYKNSTGEEW